MTETLAHLRALVDALPGEHPVTVPSAWLRELLEAAERPVEAPAPAEPPQLLTVEQAAARIGWTVGTLYRNAKGLPFTRKISHRVIRFDAAELEEWLRNRASGCRA